MRPRAKRREWLQRQRFATESSEDDLWQIVETSFHTVAPEALVEIAVESQASRRYVATPR